MSGRTDVVRDDSEPTDAQIIAWSVDQPELFAALFDRHFSTVYRYLARRVGADAAEDLASDVCLVAFERRHSYQTARSQALPWLLGIATNLARQRSRAESRALRALARSGIDTVMQDHADLVVARVVADAECRSIAGVLAKLSRGDRDVLLLTAWGGLSYDEVGVALGVPTGTVRSRLNRARRKLKAAVAAADSTDPTESGDRGRDGSTRLLPG